jgi:hypothetical protein
VNMRRLAAVARVEKETVRPAPQHGRHVTKNMQTSR